MGLMVRNVPLNKQQLLVCAKFCLGAAGCDFLQRAFWGLSNNSPFVNVRARHIFVSLSTSLAITREAPFESIVA
jgi:hypothetical protein